MVTASKPDSHSRRCAHCGGDFNPRRDSQKFCSRPCMYAARRGKPTWNSGTAVGWVDRRGYRCIRVNGRHKKVHRLVMERHLGRELEPSEDVHHVNGDTLDNRPENLRVVDHGEHTKMTHTGSERSDEARARMRRGARMRETIRRLEREKAELLEALEGLLLTRRSGNESVREYKATQKARTALSRARGDS